MADSALNYTQIMVRPNFLPLLVAPLLGCWLGIREHENPNRGRTSGIMGIVGMQLPLAQIFTTVT